MLGILRRHVIRQRFKKMIAEFDRQEAEAKAKHQPTRHIQKARQAYIHARLAGEA